VGDNPGRLSGALRQAWERSDVIITTGGLGPTQDDITRETIAGLFKEEPAVDPALKQSIVDYFAQRGIEMPASNIKQAVLVPSAAAIPNSRGTAPGWWVERDGRIIVAMPGPPGEMQFMWQNQVFPRLQRKTGAIILSRMLKTFSLTEAKVDELVTPLMSSPNPTLATYAKLDGIYLRIAAKAARRPEAEELISRHEADIKKILGDAIWGADDETQESVVGQLLTTRGLTLAVAESFTSGYLAHTLASAPGSRSYFKGGIVAATDEVKVVLGIDAGLVAGEPSAELAVAMASLARQKLGASIGIGIEGYSEPVGGTLPGTVFIAIDRESIDEPVVQRYSGRLYQMKKRAAYYALFDLMKLLRSA
jgi:nicotinamide-nucleotide amidase